MGLGVLTLALGCSSPTPKRDPQQSGDIGTKVDKVNPLSNLKLYRTYFQMELETKTAEHIEVWYETEDDGWDLFDLALNGNEMMTSIPEERRFPSTMAFAGWPSPPDKPVAVPSAIHPAVQNVIKLIPSTFPDKVIKNVVVDYMGHGARINVYEYIRAGAPKPNYTPGWGGERHYIVDTKKGTLTEFGGGGGGSSLDFLQGKLPSSWIDINLPRNLEGNTVLNLDFYDEPGQMPSCLQAPLKAQQKRLNTALIRRTREMELKTGLTSDQIFTKVLLKQEPTTLPRNVKQSIDVRLDVYGRSKNGMGNEIDSEVHLVFPVSEFPSTVKLVDAKSGIEFQGTLDLVQGTISVTATRDGKTVQGQRPIKGIEFLKDGKQAMIETGLYTEDQIELNLPGFGTISEFDIYGSRIEAGRFLKPANAGATCN